MGKTGSRQSGGDGEAEQGKDPVGEIEEEDYLNIP
jgi:hypothetical protein